MKICSICGFEKDKLHPYEGVDFYKLTPTELCLLCFKCYATYVDWRNITKGKGKVIAIAGGFDPFHEGHLDHIKKASALGDFLVVLVSNDEDMVRKKGKCNLPMWFRMKTVELWLKDLAIAGMVIATKDKDGTQAKTLTLLRPDIFAKGGDRTEANMPSNELYACKESGIEIVYGVGDLLNASSKMVI